MKNGNRACASVEMRLLDVVACEATVQRQMHLFKAQRKADVAISGFVFWELKH